MYSGILLFVVSVSQAKTCIEIDVPLSVSARLGVFDNISPPTSNLDSTTFIQNLTQQGRNFTEYALSGYTTISGDYHISATYCYPTHVFPSPFSEPSSTLQILTHGIGFDQSYWNLPYNNDEYSYIDVAVDTFGYSTLSYDRLGIGGSSHATSPDATLNEFQAALEIASLADMTNMLRTGSFPGINNLFSKIVHVGHSFGSAQSFALTAMQPNISDGLVLTGFSLDDSFLGYFGAGADFQQANLNQPSRFGSNGPDPIEARYPWGRYHYPPGQSNPLPTAYVDGYLTSSNINAQQYLFFLPDYFDVGILQFAEQTKQPVTSGELLTLASLPSSNGFAGPVMVFTGSNDLPYCGGNCFATGGAGSSIPAAMASSFPVASVFQSYIQPNTGHGIAFHYNATAGFAVIQNFLRSQGL